MAFIKKSFLRVLVILIVILSMLFQSCISFAADESYASMVNNVDDYRMKTELSDDLLKHTDHNSKNLKGYSADESSTKVSKEIIIKYKDSNDDKTVKSFSETKLPVYGAKLKKKLSKKMELIEVGSFSDTDTLIKELMKDPNVEYAQPNYIMHAFDTPNDLIFDKQWALKNSGQIIDGKKGISGADIDIQEAWNITKGSPDIIVGVLDSGIDINHPDLAGNIVPGWDFVHNDSSVYDPQDGDEHGTHIAGIIAASMNNGIGISGVAPNVKIMPLKFMSKDGGTTADAIAAIDYAEARGVKIINCSWGNSDAYARYDYALRDRMANSDILFICATGNEGLSLDQYPVYPASFHLPNQINVASVDNNNELSWFSNYGNYADVAAPGEDIISTLPGNSYGYMSGTSMAAPFVTGVAALLKSVNSDITSNTIMNIIKNTSLRIAGLSGKVNTSGVIDTQNAMNIKNNFGDKWVRKSDMPTGRQKLSAASLDGKIYVVGGYTGGYNHKTTLEVYDPSTDTWTQKADMSKAREYPGVVALNGKIYAIGGYETYDQDQTTVEEYDPVTNTWSTKTEMPTGSRRPVVVASDNKIYTLGVGGARNLTEYDPVADSWTSKSSAPHSCGSVAVYYNGEIHCIGENSVQVYNISTDTWSVKSTPGNLNLYLLEGCTLVDGRLFILNGRALLEYDLLSDTSITRQNLPSERWSFGIASSGGKLYVIGGYVYNGDFAGKIVEEYSPTIDVPHNPTNITYTGSENSVTITWDPAFGAQGYELEIEGNVVDNGMSTSYTDSGLTVGTSYLYRVRAKNSNGKSDWVAVTAKTTSNWKQGTSMNMPRAEFATAELGGKIYAIGGRGTNGTTLSSVEVFDPSTGSWTFVASLNTPRYSLEAEVINGKIYAVGGASNDGQNAYCYKVVEEYDPASNTWSIKAPMSTFRSRLGLQAVNGKLYAIGGINNNIVTSIEEYDPSINRWTQKSQLPTPKQIFSTTCVNGKIFIVSGADENLKGITTVNIYDPSTNYWSSAADVNVPRILHGVASGNGYIYLVGGTGVEAFEGIRLTEVYNVERNQWTIFESLPTKRFGLKTVFLNDKLYVIGGFDSEGYSFLNTVEVYEFTPTTVEINGAEGVSLPTAGNKTVAYTAAVKDQNGTIMNGKAITWSLASPVTGVSINSTSGILTVSSEAQPGSVTISATSGTITNTYQVTLSAPVITSIDINGAAYISLPEDGNATQAYAAIVKDQYGAPLQSEQVTWSIVEQGVAASVNAISGVVTTNNAQPGTSFTLRAVSNSLPTVFGTKVVTLVVNSNITPMEATFDKNPNVQADISITMNLNGNTLNAINNGATPLTRGTDYTVADRVVTIKKGYLASLGTGLHTLTFVFNAGDNAALGIRVIDSTAPSNNNNGTANNGGGGDESVGGPGTGTDGINGGGSNTTGGGGGGGGGASSPIDMILNQKLFTDFMLKEVYKYLEGITQDLYSEKGYDYARAMSIDMANDNISGIAKLLAAVSDTKAKNKIINETSKMLDGITNIASSPRGDDKIHEVVFKLSRTVKESSELLNSIQDGTDKQEIARKVMNIIKVAGLVINKMDTSDKTAESIDKTVKSVSILISQDKGGILKKNGFEEIKAALESFLGNISKTDIESKNEAGVTKASISVEMEKSLLKKADTVLEAGDSVKREISQSFREIKVETNVVLKVYSQNESTAVQATLPADLIDSLKAKGIEKVTITTDIVSLSIESNAFNTSSADSVIFEVRQADKEKELTPVQKSIVGSNPIFDFNSLVLDKTGKEKKVSSFSSDIRVAIPYALLEGQDPNKITVYYINDKGLLENKYGQYDAATKCVVFKTNHFSKYMISENKALFSDLDKYKAYEKYVDAVAANGIMKAKSGDKFIPGDSITRAELAEILISTFKIPGINDKNLKCNFTDVKQSDPSYKAISLINKLGLMSGNGKKFNPTGKVTRQEMALVLSKALKLYKNIAVKNGETKKYVTFSDTAKLSTGEKDAIAMMVKNNIMNAKTGKMFKPNDGINRAEAAQIFYSVIYLK